MWQICMISLNPLWNLHWEIFHPHLKFPSSYLNDWILRAKISQTAAIWPHLLIGPNDCLSCDLSNYLNLYLVSILLSFPVCGGELTNTYGDVKSPGYPGNYPPNRDCYWTVNVNPGLLITFAFGTLSLEHHDNCNFDYLEVKLVASCIHFKGVFCAYMC